MRHDNQVCVNAALEAVSGFVRLNCYNLRETFVVTPHIQDLAA